MSKLTYQSALLVMVVCGLWAPIASATQRPNIVILTVDTLRADRLSGYGYERETSPNIDRLMANGARFDSARTPEPLTAPALSSLWTGLEPHEHGCSRNGLAVHKDLPSLAKLLHLRGYETAAFVGNWTLRDKLSGLGEHFGTYSEIFSRKRWFGLIKGEATAEDLNSEALSWIEEHQRESPERPFLLWIHYVEPHEPYRQWDEFLEPLGYSGGTELDDRERYDTEIAYVDARIGELLEGNPELHSAGANAPLIVFAADHGESLGEHGYWGHGRNLMEPNLRVPLSVSWPGQIPPSVIEQDATLVDLPKTVLGLLDLTAPDSVKGLDWSGVLLRNEEPPAKRVSFYQAHKGAVQPTEVPEKARRRGLLEIARLEDGRKTVWHMNSEKRSDFDLVKDPKELQNLSEGSALPDDLVEWLEQVKAGLDLADADGAVVMDEETVEQLRALGYIE